jgi:hypothetical protein
MAEFYQNQTIKVEKDLNLKQAEGKVRKFLRGVPDLVTGYIYVDGPTVSDLFVIRKGVAKKCTDQEWLDYFRTYLCPTN